MTTRKKATTKKKTVAKTEVKKIENVEVEFVRDPDVVTVDIKKLTKLLRRFGIVDRNLIKSIKKLSQETAEQEKEKQDDDRF